MKYHNYINGKSNLYTNHIMNRDTNAVLNILK